MSKFNSWSSKRFYSFISICYLYVLTACGTPTPFNDDINGSQSKSYVTYDQARRAFELVGAVDYLPFEYKLDGCYARSMYMAMELASEKIASSSQFALGNLEPSREISWWYHVAPMLVATREDPKTAQAEASYTYQKGSSKELLAKQANVEPIILDPSLHQSPVWRSNWIESLKAKGELELIAIPGNQNNPYMAYSYKYDKYDLARSYEEMGEFSIYDIEASCLVMLEYLELEGQNILVETAKKNKLLQRTGELFEILSSVEHDKVNSSGRKLTYNGRCGFVAN
ncbi:MAG: hypothetical protein KBD78_03695 [Oligoflexales bacterium]|nr:hypothetical protein [Oligoflexales bacterium]